MDATDKVRARALAGAMRLFWERGVTASSYGEIVAATGLSRKALYGFWPDKEALVRETLAHYRTAVLDGMLARLRPPGAEALNRFWTGIDAAARMPGWNGCYLFRSAGGELRHDAEVRALFDAYIAALNQAFVDAILAAIPELPRSRVLDAGAAAWQAVSLASLASTLGGGRGYDARVAEVFRAGRLACGLPPA